MNSRTDSPTSDSPDQLIRNIQKLMDEVEAVVAKSTDSAGHEFSEKFDELQDRLAAATDKVRGAYTTARKKVVAGAQRADDTIRSHPYESLAITLGIGVILGAFLRRRD
jgi:ElaB/YqjD/DUF883 family membrane-anchored ribosome-binding protein